MCFGIAGFIFEPVNEIPLNYHYSKESPQAVLQCDTVVFSVPKWNMVFFIYYLTVRYTKMHGGTAAEQ